MVEWKRRFVPLGLGVGMLATVVAAALSPNLGVVAAQTNCQYSDCSSGTSTAFPWWIVAVIAVVVVIALIAAVLMLRRRRPPSGSTGPTQAWEPPAGPSSPGASGRGGSPPSAGASPAYLETPEDVGNVPPSVGTAAVAGGAAAGTAAAGTEAEPDIDSLMAELDKISGEILKKAPKNGGGSSGGNP